MNWLAVAIGIVCIVVGLIGIVVPVLPGLLLVWAGIGVWAVMTHTLTAWVILGVATVVYAVGIVLEVLIPGRRMRAAGVTWFTMAVGVAGAIVGALFIPAVGFFIGFPLAVFLLELSRQGDSQHAWQQTVHALKGMGLNILIELSAGLVLAAAFTVGVLLSVF